MRRLNAIVSMAVLALFLIHAAVGGLQLAGVLAGGSAVMSVLAWVMVGLIAVHVVIGIKLTADTLAAQKKAGTAYFKENRLFWTRRISGMAVMLFIAAHIIVFMGESSGGVYRLTLFNGVRLAEQILLVLSVGVHVITNIKPLMIAFGAKSGRELALDILLITSAVLLISGVGFVIYYIRWLSF